MDCLNVTGGLFECDRWTVGALNMTEGLLEYTYMYIYIWWIVDCVMWEMWYEVWTIRKALSTNSHDLTTIISYDYGLVVPLTLNRQDEYQHLPDIQVK